MIEKFNTFKQYNFWDKKHINAGYIRKSYLKKIQKSNNTNLIKVLIGQRRVGKSYSQLKTN